VVQRGWSRFETETPAARTIEIAVVRSREEIDAFGQWKLGEYHPWSYCSAKMLAPMLNPQVQRILTIWKYVKCDVCLS